MVLLCQQTLRLQTFVSHPISLLTGVLAAWLSLSTPVSAVAMDWLSDNANLPSERLDVVLSNPSNTSLKEHPVTIDLDKYKLADADYIVVTDENGKRLPAQADDLDLNGASDELVFLANFGPEQSRHVYIYPFTGAERTAEPLKKRVHARLALDGEAPKQEITAEDGNMYGASQHHGPAWESELMAYRVYFDKKSTIDLYGKRTHQLELQRTQWYSSDELRKKGYGQDIIQVGDTLGVGSLRGWNGSKAILMTPVESRTARVLADGPVRAIVEMAAQGWDSPAGKRTVVSRFSIFAGKRYVIHEVRVEGQEATLPPLCTGIRKFERQKMYKKNGLMTGWGEGGMGETIGLGVFIPPEEFGGFRETRRNHVALLKSTESRTLRFAFAAVWKNEPSGPTNREAFNDYMHKLSRKALVSIEVTKVNRESL